MTPTTSFVSRDATLRPLRLLSGHVRKASRELLSSTVRGAHRLYPSLAAVPTLSAAAHPSPPLPRSANRVAQLTVILGGGYCAVWNYQWLRQGIQGAHCAALLRQQEVLAPQGPLAELLLPALLAAAGFGHAVSWAHSFEAQPVTRSVAAVAVCTAVCLLLATEGGDRPGAYVPLLLGCAVAAGLARSAEARLLPRPSRHAYELPVVRLAPSLAPQARAASRRP